MTIQVTLNANEFNKSGIIKDGKIHNGKYDSLKVIRFGNGRIYLMALNSEINGKVGTFAKQMKLENGLVILSFGKNDKLVIGSYVDSEIQNETINECEEVTEATTEQISESKQLKVSNQKEQLTIRGYMNKVEERIGQRIDHHELELYLVHFGKRWSIYEKNTGKSISGSMKTKKEALDKLEEFLDKYYKQMKEAIKNTICKDGHISDYKIGMWIR